MGLILGLVAGLKDKEFRKKFILDKPPFYITFLLTVIASFLNLFGILPTIFNLPTYHAVAIFLFLTIYILNIRQTAVLLILVGAILNAAVIMANKGSMPVSLKMYQRYGGIFFNLPQGRIYIIDTTVLPWLGDWLYFPHAGSIFSFGDVLIAMGLLILNIQYMFLRFKKSAHH